MRGRYLSDLAKYDSLTQELHGSSSRSRSIVLLERAEVTCQLGFPLVGYYDLLIAEQHNTQQGIAPTLSFLLQAAQCQLLLQRKDLALSALRAALSLASPVEMPQVIFRLEEANAAPESMRGPNVYTYSEEQFPWDKRAAWETITSEEALEEARAHVEATSGGPLRMELFPDAGRGLVASRTISPGEVLITDKARTLAVSWPFVEPSLCHHCNMPLDKITRPLTCCQCPCRFCSTTCQQTAQDAYHATLCGITLHPFLVQAMQLEDNPSTLWIVSALKVFTEAKRRGVEALDVPSLNYLGVAPRSDTPVGCQENIFALYQVVAGTLGVTNQPGFEFWDFMAIGQRSKSNGFGSTVGNVLKRSIFGSVSYANHNCQPNARANGQGQLVTTRHLEEGQQVFISYVGDEGMLRHLILEKYGITCSCRVCASARSEFEAYMREP